MLKVSLLIGGVMSCLGIGWPANQKLWEVIIQAVVTTVLTGVATVFAAKYGANRAFELNVKMEYEKKRNENYVNGRMALFNLTRMFDILHALKVQIIDPHRNDELSLITIPAVPPREIIKLNYEALSYLFETDYPNLLTELAITEEWYAEAIKHVNERSRLHRQEFQSQLERLEKEKLDPGQTKEIQIKNILGNTLFLTLKNATTLMISEVDATQIRIKKNAEQLSKCLQGLFPERKPFNLVFPDEYKI